MMRRFWNSVRGVVATVRDTATEVGQTTAEYALVILGAAAIGTVLITWATRGHVIQNLFSSVLSKILPG